jgi:hypothetical protein
MASMARSTFEWLSGVMKGSRWTLAFKIAVKSLWIPALDVVTVIKRTESNFPEVGEPREDLNQRCL